MLNGRDAIVSGVPLPGVCALSADCAAGGVLVASRATGLKIIGLSSLLSRANEQVMCAPDRKISVHNKQVFLFMIILAPFGYKIMTLL